MLAFTIDKYSVYKKYEQKCVEWAFNESLLFTDWSISFKII